jgi:hypothetical protein
VEATQLDLIFGWAALLSAVATMGTLITGILFFAVNETFGRANDTASVFQAVLMLPVAVAMYLLTHSGNGGLALPTPPPSPTPRPTEASMAQGRCGDGVCDEVEQQDPALCPQDCATPGAEPKGRCGDGVCDEAEQKTPGLCAQDCLGAAGAPTPCPTPDAGGTSAGRGRTGGWWWTAVRTWLT